MKDHANRSSLHLPNLARIGRSKTSTPVQSRGPSPSRKMSETDLIVRVTVVQGRNLAAKDRNGTSDPFIVVHLNDYHNQTHCIPKSLDPVWNSTFDIPLHGHAPFILHGVCWDKDRFGKDYMGEFAVPLDELNKNGSWEPQSRWFSLISTRKKSKISGEIKLDIAILDGKHKPAAPELIVAKLKNIPSVPPTPASELDSFDLDLHSEDDDTVSSDELSRTEDGRRGKRQTVKDKTKAKIKKTQQNAYEFAGSPDVVGVIFLEIGSITDLPPEKNVTRTSFDMDPFVVVSLGKKTYKTRVIRHCLDPVFDEKMLFQVLRHEKNYSLSFSVVDRDKLSGNDFVAEVTLAVQDIMATQPEARSEDGLYELPEPSPDLTPSISHSSRSRFRLPLSRSSSSNNLVTKKSRPDMHSQKSSVSILSLGHLSTESSSPTISSIPTSVPTSSPTNGHGANEDGGNLNKIPTMNDSHDLDLRSFTLPLSLKNKERWEGKHSPELKIRAKYIPYAALRQQFWRVMLRQYDADDSGMISRVELTTMLDSLGSTLKPGTIDAFFERFADKDATSKEDRGDAELTIDQTVICLEDQLVAQSKASSHVLSNATHQLAHGLHFRRQDSGHEDFHYRSSDSNSEPHTPAHQSTLSLAAMGSAGEEGREMQHDGLTEEGDKSTEHVIMVKECPLCHQPRLNKRSEVDIVTHLATCASQDWRQVDRLVMGGFVTSSQAQRKWYSKVITKISYGGYKVGANSANILVQDRITGIIQEERMSVYVRLGIRLLYKGLKSSSMEKRKIRSLLESLSIKQGKKYDNPLSVRDIKPFIAFHQLDLDEVLRPFEEFKSFNEFFYRELKPGARPVSHPENSKIIVSPADCRSVVFDTIDDATTIWIKGRDFTVERLLGKNAYGDEAKRFEGGSLGIFRLAPQDYHRFHIPVDGIMCEPKLVKGEYYTVNPMAIRSALDVYGENVRVVVPFDSKDHGRVMVVCVGAMMVGSTVITAKTGAQVERGQELGYFQFGGSTLIVLFEPGRMKWDDDLIDNSNSKLETLIRVGMSVGHSPEVGGVGHEVMLSNPTPEDRAAAQRRVAGSLAPSSS